MNPSAQHPGPMDYSRHLSLVEWYREINASAAQAKVIEAQARALGVEVTPLSIDTDDFSAWTESHDHALPPPDYDNAPPGIAGLLGDLRREKLLEFFLTLRLFPHLSQGTLLDVGCGAQPLFAERLAIPMGTKCWAVDPSLADRESDGRMNYLRGFVSEAEKIVPTADLITLHCSFEMFRPSEMSAVLALAQAKLRSGGMLLILPLYLAPQRTIYADAAAAPPEWSPEDDSDPDVLVGVHDFWGLDWTEWLPPKALNDRLVEPYPMLHFSLLRVMNSHDVTPASFLRFIGQWVKK